MCSRSLVVLPALILVFLTGCGSDDSRQSPLPLDNASVQADGQNNGGAVQCDAPAFDFAEQLFTEIDRQWYCSVSAGGGLQIYDEVFFSRRGTAVTTRFREVYWNRSLDDQVINVASPAVSPFVISNISSSNTVLTFTLLTDTGRSEAYDCILVGREGVDTGLAQASLLQ